MSSATPSSTSVTHFSLAGQSLKLDTAEDIRPHLSPLSRSPNTFTSLDISGNTLGITACEELAHVLSTTQSQSLLSVNFADIFTSRLLSEIPPALQALLNKGLLKLPKCHTVNLSDNAFGLNTVAPLEEFLSQHVPLEHLILQNNGLGPFAGIKVADALETLAQRKKGAHKLQTIICGRNRLESGSMAAWAKAIIAHREGLRTIKMVQNGIRQDGIITLLSQGLSHCTSGSLECIDLQDNTFTVTGAQALAKVVGTWAGLTELGVGDCLLGARGGVLVAEALAKGTNSKLEVLRLQYNEVDARGVKAFAQAGKAIPSLRRVELNGNKFAEEDEGVEQLRLLLDERREKAGASAAGGDEWGLDELSDLEEDSDEEEEDEVAEDEEEEESEAKGEKMLNDVELAEQEPVSEKADGDVDKLADMLGRAHV